MILIFQVAAGVLLGGLALWGAYSLWLTAQALPMQRFNLGLWIKELLLSLAIGVVLIAYVVLAEMGGVPCWMLLDDDDWREIAQCDGSAGGGCPLSSAKRCSNVMTDKALNPQL
jgi:hypothetical protein